MMKDFLKEHGFEAKNLKAVLFDMDGVLFDSMKNHARSWTEAARRHQLKLTEEEVYLNEGRTGSGTIQALALKQWGRGATEEECQLIYRTKSDLFNACPKVRPMPGARQLLETLAQEGLMRVVVTGSGQVSLLDRLNAAFPGAFSKELMVTAFDVKHGKPHPEPYLKGLQKAGVKPQEAVVVENAPLGVEAARSAGVFTIAVNTGPLANEVLAKAGANVVLSSMEELARQVTAYRCQPRLA